MERSNEPESEIFRGSNARLGRIVSHHFEYSDTN
jgi:hypothetical protein